MNKKEQPFRKTGKPRGIVPATHGASHRAPYDAHYNNHSSPEPAYRFAG